jgi:hypothetical protein
MPLFDDHSAAQLRDKAAAVSAKLDKLKEEHKVDERLRAVNESTQQAIRKLDEKYRITDKVRNAQRRRRFDHG